MRLKSAFLIARESKINIKKHYLISFLTYLNLKENEAVPIIAISSHLNISEGFTYKLLDDYLSNTDDYEYAVIDGIPSVVKV
jgi:hypothetical protein